MFIPPFCPYATCEHHHVPSISHWWCHVGFHRTKAFGAVQRFRCRHCGRTFSVQTFSVHYYAKRIIQLQRLERLAAASMSTRALSRELRCSCGTITNRIDRLARQAIGLHASLRNLARHDEPVCFDGIVSFDSSQYFPNDIGVSITHSSRFMLGLSHATTRRSGAMRDDQKLKLRVLYTTTRFEERAIERSFTQHLDMLECERPITKTRPLVLVTDEKIEYEQAFRKHRLYTAQDENRRCVRVLVSSTAPRVFSSPLFASNYIDREIRKDQANHRRETACFSRNASNTMSRLYSYLVYHNYSKKYLIRWPVHRHETAANMAGIPKSLVGLSRRRMFSHRTFLSHLALLPIDRQVWTKTLFSALRGGLFSCALPKFVFS